LTRRRAAREPMAYLRGCQEFYGLGILVNRAVLVPRPETETLVEVALQAIPPAPGVVVDVGTGSGAVALALAVYGPPTWEILGVDVSPAALLTAALNRARLRQTRRVTLFRSDLLAAVPGLLSAVVANLPYVADADAVDPEVRHEPAEAVFAGPDGLRLIRRLIDEAVARLRPGGPLLLEVGIGQAATVRRWMEEAGFSGVAIERDGAGVPRVVWGRWSAR
jgi:release factor glutamine methyltransferase